MGSSFCNNNTQIYLNIWFFMGYMCTNASFPPQFLPVSSLDSDIELKPYFSAYALHQKSHNDSVVSWTELYLLHFQRPYCTYEHTHYAPSQIKTQLDNKICSTNLNIYVSILIPQVTNAANTADLYQMVGGQRAKTNAPIRPRGREREEGGREKWGEGRDGGGDSRAGKVRGGERWERGEYRQHRRRGVLGIAINPTIDNDHSATVLQRNSASPKPEKGGGQH